MGDAYSRALLALRTQMNGSKGSVAWDAERLNELQVADERGEEVRYRGMPSSSSTPR